MMDDPLITVSPLANSTTSPNSKAALSFCFAPSASNEYDLCRKDDEYTATLSTLRDTCQTIMTNTQCDISVTANDKATAAAKHALVDTPTDYNLTLTGTMQALNDTRSDLLLNCPIKIEMTLPIPTAQQPSNELFDPIAKETNTTVEIIPHEPHQSSFASEHTANVIITGIPDDAERCRVRLLVLLDETLGLHSDTIAIPLKLQYLIGGRKRTGLQTIIEETCTNLYFPSPFADPDSDQDIYITGEPSNVARVKDMLTKLANQKAKSMYHKSVSMVTEKLDWMLLHRKDELRKVMHDNGSYVALPTLGSGDDRMHVYAENRVNAERTLRAVNFVACSIYEAVFFFNNNQQALFDASSGAFFDSLPNLATMVSQLSQVSGAQVVYKTEPGCIQVMGTERAIRNVYQRLQEMAFLKPFHQGTIFRVESANEQRDFISGKKNGKINKIMKTSGAKIRFLPMASDYNFIIEVDSTSFTKALDGLTLLQEELPAEISFFVPEAYHKRIIGVGGKNIQRIMKKYGVYVKFSNTEEFASLGGYYDNDDNVVARTPMKNQINLDNLRHAVMELIHPKDRDYVARVVRVPARLHRLLIHNHTPFFNEDICKKTNCRLFWPDSELASDDVTLIGPEAQMDLAINMLQSTVPRDYELRAPKTDAITALLADEAFQHAVVLPLQQEYGVTFTSKPDADCEEDMVLVLHNTYMETFAAVLDLLIVYLKSKDIKFYEQKIKPMHAPPPPPSAYPHLQFAAAAAAGAGLAHPSLVHHPHHGHPGALRPPMGVMSTGSGLSPVMSSSGTATPTLVSGASGANPLAMPPMSSGSNLPPRPPFFMKDAMFQDIPGMLPPGGLGFPGQPYRIPSFDMAGGPVPSTSTGPANPDLPNASSASSSTSTATTTNTTTAPAPPAGQGNAPPAGNMDNWKTPGQLDRTSSLSESNLRAIFDGPLDLTEQERRVLATYQYQRMSMPLSSTFSGFAPPSGDIWSQRPPKATASTANTNTPPTSQPTSGTSAATSPPPTVRTFGSSGIFTDLNPFASNYMDFNPYGDDKPPLKSSKSMPEPLLESHFQQPSSQPPTTNNSSQHHTSSSTHHPLSSYSSGFPGGLGYPRSAANPTSSLFAPGDENLPSFLEKMSLSSGNNDQ
ncbi:hypothetical protein DM01DRAFT_1407241 [Hesseltinella vesiculosa]|uniref:K Homology domain-containing protein n=1 Tax=Hesseltinella vesiculosa TaxID=101127 RepID=A0A1X2GI52_9FUNG|nr:hypothetical protein DM01DRAFT_1407241 [Hesseltinella vesiculosa]